MNFVDDKQIEKTHHRFKGNKMAAIDKLCILQDDLFKEGMKYNEYENYIQDKINHEHFYYKHLSSDHIDFLKGRFKKKNTKKENKLTLKLSERNRKNRQISLFKDKKRHMIYEQKKGVIDALFKEINRTKAIGVTGTTDLLSNDPEKFTETKKYFFTGGRYFEGSDKGWVNIYQKLVSNNNAHLFNLHSPSSLNDHVYNH